MILGDLIKQYRRDHSCSMDQFSKLSGLSKAYISILERNVNPVNGKPVIPSLETIKAVSQAIGMDFNDVIAILDGDQPVSLKPESPSSASPRNPTQDTLISLFTQLNEDGQNKVIDYAKDLVSTDHYNLAEYSADEKAVIDSFRAAYKEALENGTNKVHSKGAKDGGWSVHTYSHPSTDGFPTLTFLIDNQPEPTSEAASSIKTKTKTKTK